MHRKAGHIVRLRKRHLLFLALLAVAVAIVPTIANSAIDASITAVDNGVYEHSWQANGVAPAEVAITPGNSVSFAYPSGTNHHYPVFESGPATPTCEGLPHALVESGPGWSGSCTFTAAGTYEFWCGVHGSTMKAFVHVNASGTLPPTASTGVASPVGETEATLRGTVNPMGQPTSYHFDYGTSTSYNLHTGETPAGEDSIAHGVSAPVKELSPGTTYHVQLVATYASGASTVLGGDRTFVTASPPGAPLASTGEATAIGETDATLNGQVNPNGKATTWFFNYGTTNGYGHTTAVVSAGEGSTSRLESIPVTGLLPGTTYHFQIVAHNALGDAPGLDQTFKTNSPAPPPTETTTTTTTTSPPSVSGGAAPPPPSPGAGLGVIGGSPLAGSASTAIKVPGAQHGSSIHGSLAISPAGAGARLQVDLLATSASLARKRSRQVRIGRFLRASVAAGSVSFSVPLNAKAKRALHRRHRLPVVVQITLTPLHGTPVSTTRSVTLH